jgi:hypothetical protein
VLSHTPATRAAVAQHSYSIGESFSRRDQECHWVASVSNSLRLYRRAVAPALAATLFCVALFAPAATHSDDPSSDSVGVIDGDAITVNGPMNVEVVHGQTKTVLRSGSDIRVKSSSARIDLVDGGQISICGPAHLSVLKSGNSLTVALNTGAIHLYVESDLVLTIYTPQLLAQTISIGGGARDILAGFDAAGAMCIRAIRGAVRLEHQLTGKTVLVPQTADILVTDGQFESMASGAGRCSCELQVGKTTPPPPEISRLATTDEIRAEALVTKPNASPAPPEIPGAVQEPIYTVLMPPLVYNANSKVQLDYDPKTIVLIRRVRIRSTLTFHGRVEGETVATAKPPSPPAPSTTPSKSAPPASDSFSDRVRKFVHKLWSSGS